jgi:hypothetical protein
MLEYLRLHPGRLSATHPTAVFISPWAPGNVYLPLIPAFLIANEHSIIPSLLPFIQNFGNSFSVAKTLLSSSTSSLASVHSPGEDTPQTQPKHEMLSYLYPEIHQLIGKYMWAEEQQGISQEHLLCLGKGVQGNGTAKVGSREWIERATRELKLTAQQGREDMKLNVHVWWGSGDGMVPRNARGMLIQQAGSLRPHSHTFLLRFLRPLHGIHTLHPV